MGFIEAIVSKIPVEHLPQLRKEVYVFPTRRAGLYFRNLLASHFSDDVFVAPQVLTIEEFNAEVVGNNATHELRLLFELYEVYRKHEPGLKFDKFYAWGNILLGDFNDIDKNLVEADKLYGNLKNVKEIDTAFGETEETLQAFNEFRDLLSDEHESEIIRKFQRNWEMIRKVYNEFREALEQKGLAYSGLIDRKAVECLEENIRTLNYDVVHFCGFNALTLSEERLFDLLSDAGKARIYWDADKLYLDDENNEAGAYLRRYRRRWRESSVWIIHDMAAEAKKIEVIGAAKTTAQAKIAGDILASSEVPPERTAVVLADENLLIPVLYSIPPEWELVNVTMGYPLRFSSFYALIRTFFELATHAGKTEDPYLKGSLILDLLGNPIVQAVTPNTSALSKSIIEERRTWIRRSSFVASCQSKILIDILKFPGETRELLDHLIDILVKLFYLLRDDDQVSRVHLEFDYHFLKHLKNLSNQINEYPHRLDTAMLYRILHESILQARVPFVGEPVRGLQVMGFLESRLLDFDKLVIVSVNEGKLPATHRKYTYIPFAVRKAFGLPTFDQTDRIYSYHFKRLLQRAKQIHLIYDTEVAIDGSGEKSRYLLQLNQELSHSPSTITQKTYTTVLNLKDSDRRITVQKTGEVIKKLGRYLVGTGERDLGPTLLTNYIECTLRFYFKHVAGIPEREELADEMDAREFGIVAHDAFEFLYEDYIGQWLDKDRLKELRKPENVDKVVNRALTHNRYMHEGQPLEGRNLLNRAIIVRLVDRVLEQDMKEAPIKIISLEKSDYKYQLDLGDKKVSLGGKIDRLDAVKYRDVEQLRVIDYKTGKVKMVGSYSAMQKDPDKYIPQYFEDGSYKSGFQTYYYGLILKRNFPDKAVKSGIYSLQEVNRGIRFLRGGYPVDEVIFDGYEERLKAMVSELYNPDIPFVETEDHDNCEYCAFRHICRSR